MLQRRGDLFTCEFYCDDIIVERQDRIDIFCLYRAFLNACPYVTSIDYRHIRSSRLSYDIRNEIAEVRLCFSYVFPIEINLRFPNYFVQEGIHPLLVLIDYRQNRFVLLICLRPDLLDMAFKL